MTVPPREVVARSEQPVKRDLRTRVLEQVVALEGERGPRRNLIRPVLSADDRDLIADDVTLVATSKNRSQFLQIAREIDEIREFNAIPNDPPYSTTFAALYDGLYSALTARSAEALTRMHMQLQPDMIRELARANFPDRPELLDAYYNPLINTFILEDVQTDLI